MKTTTAHPVCTLHVRAHLAPFQERNNLTKEKSCQISKPKSAVVRKRVLWLGGPKDGATPNTTAETAASHPWEENSSF